MFWVDDGDDEEEIEVERGWVPSIDAFFFCLFLSPVAPLQPSFSPRHRCRCHRNDAREARERWQRAWRAPSCAASSMERRPKRERARDRSEEKWNFFSFSFFVRQRKRAAKKNTFVNLCMLPHLSFFSSAAAARARRRTSQGTGRSFRAWISTMHGVGGSANNIGGGGGASVGRRSMASSTSASSSSGAPPPCGPPRPPPTQQQQAFQRQAPMPPPSQQQQQKQQQQRFSAAAPPPLPLPPPPGQSFAARPPPGWVPLPPPQQQQRQGQQQQ